MQDYGVIMQGDLTANFSRWEFACKGKKCCNGSAPVDSRALRGLQTYRNIIDSITNVVSGFRCKKHNSETPGAAADSTHCKAEGFDIETPGKTIDEMYEVLKSVYVFVDGCIILHDTYIHVDARETGSIFIDARTKKCEN